MLVECLLKPAQAAVCPQSLDGGDRTPPDLNDGDQAGADLFAIEQDGAGTAITGVAADLGPGQSEMVSEHAREPGGGVCADLDRAGR